MKDHDDKWIGDRADSIDGPKRPALCFGNRNGNDFAPTRIAGMYWNRVHIGSLGTAILGLALSGNMPIAKAAAPADACSLLTTSEASAALGAQLDSGERAFSSSPATCVWKERGRKATGYAQVTVTLADDQKFEMGKTPLEGVQKTPESGIGDDAYFVELVRRSASDDTATLSVRKGSQSFTVLVLSHNLSSDKVKSVERTVALKILPKL